jgi:hypothetical protein
VLVHYAARRACIYCGCTDDRACVVPLQTVDSPEIRAAHDRFLASCGVLGLVPQATIACWWISIDPPVCSAPSCARRHAAAKLFDRIRDEAPIDGESSREIAGQGTV